VPPFFAGFLAACLVPPFFVAFFAAFFVPRFLAAFFVDFFAAPFFVPFRPALRAPFPFMVAIPVTPFDWSDFGSP
jgi:hypothetical protein